MCMHRQRISSKDYVLLGRLPNSRIPVYWDVRHDRYVKVLPYPSGTLDKDGNVIPHALVDDGHGGTIRSERLVARTKRKAYKRLGRVADWGMCLLALFIGIRVWLSSSDDVSEPPLWLCLAALVIGLVLGRLTSQWLVRNTYADGFVLDATPREVRRAVNGYRTQYQWGFWLEQLLAEISAWGFCLLFLMGILCDYDYIPRVALKYGVFALFGVLIVFDAIWLWFKLIAGRIPRKRYDRSRAEDVLGW